jgi:hypothetical protein
LYVDGQLIDAKAARSRISIGSTELYLGGHPTLGYHKLSGWIDEVKVFGRSLTQREVTRLFNQR